MSKLIKKFQNSGRISQEEIDKANAKRTYINIPSARPTDEVKKLWQEDQKVEEVSNAIKDFGTGVLTWGTKFSPPTQEELKMGRGSWSERLPLIVDAAEQGLVNEMMPKAVSNVATVVSKMPGWNSLVGAARKNDFTQFNPLAFKAKSNKAYAPVSEKKAERMMESGHIYRGTKEGEVTRYFPILGEEGKPTMYKPVFEKDFITKRKIEPQDMVEITFPNKKTISVPAEDIYAGKFEKYLGQGRKRSGVKLSFNGIPLNNLTPETTIPSVPYSGKAAPDMKFQVGKIPNYKQFGISGDYILEASPSKMGLVKGAFRKPGSTKAGFPFKINEKRLQVGEWGIPKRAITEGEFSTLGEGNRLMKRHPIWGYQEVVDPEKLGVSQHPLSKAILGIENFKIAMEPRNIKSFVRGVTSPSMEYAAGPAIQPEKEFINTMDKIKKASNLVVNPKKTPEEVVKFFESARIPFRDRVEFGGLTSQSRLDELINSGFYANPTGELTSLIDAAKAVPERSNPFFEKAVKYAVNDPYYRAGQKLRVWEKPATNKLLAKESGHFTDLSAAAYNRTGLDMDEYIKKRLEILNNSAPDKYSLGRNLSDQSYPLSITHMPRLDGTSNLNQVGRGSYTLKQIGYSTLNNEGYFANLGIPASARADYMNNILGRYAKGGKRLPAAVPVRDQVFVPYLGIIKRRL